MLADSLLQDDQIEPLADGVLDVLSEVGVLCQNDELLQALDAAGASVDHTSQRVKFPRPMAAEFIDNVRRVNADRAGWPERFSAPGLAGIGTQVAQFFHDHDTGELRSSNREDFITCTKFGDVLHEGRSVGHSLAMTDVPPLLEPLEAGMLLAEYAHDPGPPFAWNARQVDYLIEMGEVLGKQDWFTMGAMCFAHPLRLDRDVADRFVRQVRQGGSAGITAMPVAGLTTPVTVEGFVVVASAEVVATWIAGRALNPEAPLGGSMWAGSVDMRTGAVSYSAFDAMFYAFACVQFLRKWAGAYIPVGAGEYCDAKAPGLYTALEKAYKALLVTAFTGQSPGAGSGLVDEGKTLSLIQLLLDREYASGARLLARSIDPTPEKIALPTILEIGVGLSGNYFETDHTLAHFRSSVWLPELLDRSGWNGFAAEEEVLAKTRARVNDLISQYEKPDGREDQLAAMRQVVERAKRELLDWHAPHDRSETP